MDKQRPPLEERLKLAREFPMYEFALESGELAELEEALRLSKTAHVDQDARRLRKLAMQFLGSAAAYVGFGLVILLVSLVGQ